LLTLDQVESFLDLLQEDVVVAEVVLDLEVGQVDQHACDFRSVLFTNHDFNVLVDELADCVFAIWVVGVDARDQVS